MKTSDLQRAAEHADLEWQRKREEKFRNATRHSKWLQRKRRLKTYGANMTCDMVKHAGR